MLLCRIGGDEFALFCPYESLEKVNSLAQKIISSSKAPTPYDIDGTILKIGASVGSSILPDDSTDLDNLFSLADQRMYKHKNNKRAGRVKTRDYLDQVLR